MDVNDFVENIREVIVNNSNIEADEDDNTLFSDVKSVTADVQNRTVYIHFSNKTIALSVHVIE